MRTMKLIRYIINDFHGLLVQADRTDIIVDYLDGMTNTVNAD